MVSNNVPADTSRYFLAKATHKLFARVIDYIVVLSIVAGLSIWIISSDSAGLKNAFSLVQTWRYFLISIIALLIFSFYFILMPNYLWKCFTVGNWLLKLKLYKTIPTKNMLICLIRRELFIWIILVIVNVSLGITLCAMSSGTAHKFIVNLLKLSGNDDSYLFGTTIFHILYVATFVLLFGIIINVCLTSKKQSIIDKFSNIVLIKLVDKATTTISPIINKSKINYGLPGENIA